MLHSIFFIIISGGSSTKSLRPQPKKVGGWLMASLRKSPVLEISDPNPIFQIAPIPTHPLRHIAYYNDIHNQNLNIHTVNYIHMWFYLCMNIINILMILNQC